MNVFVGVRVSVGFENVCVTFGFLVCVSEDFNVLIATVDFDVLNVSGLILLTAFFEVYLTVCFGSVRECTVGSVFSSGGTISPESSSENKYKLYDLKKKEYCTLYYRNPDIKPYVVLFFNKPSLPGKI